MFRRLPSGLPKDPVFPCDLKGLGYFINDNDEVRSIENPNAYFKFFLTRNDRHNAVQRESMNEALRNIICGRLEKLGLEKIRLPLGAKETEANVPIFVSTDLKEKKRVVILFYEHPQDLGVLAQRIIGGPGGINKGSVVNLVKAIQANADAPGIILANMGQLRWWRRGKKAVTQVSWNTLPQKSAVCGAYRFDEEKNTIPGNRNTAEHVDYIFNHVVDQFVNADAKIQVIGVSEGAVQVSKFLDENFAKWGSRVTALAAVATYVFVEEFINQNFVKWFKDHGRAYIISDEPAGAFLADYDGSREENNPVPAYGCPVFSLAVPYYSELLLPIGYQTMVDWFEEVSKSPNYANPRFIRYNSDGEEVGEDAATKEVMTIEEEGLEQVHQVDTGLEEAKEIENKHSLVGAVFSVAGYVIQGPERT